MSQQYGWTRTVQHCFDRHGSFDAFTPNAFQVTRKWACMMLHLDMADLIEGNDTVYAIEDPLLSQCPYFCMLQ